MLQVIKNRKKFYAFTIILSVIALIFTFSFNINLWIDLTWWTKLEYSYSEWNIDTKKIENDVIAISKKIKNENREVINNISVYNVTWEKKFVVLAWFDNTLKDDVSEKYKNEFKTKTLELLNTDNKSIELTDYQNIWKSFWDYIKKSAIITLIIWLIWISVYLAIAFSWFVNWISSLSFASITIITLFHDILVATWLYIVTSHFIPSFKIDTFFITALLTILWYSINDTIVTLDRIRYNLWLAWKTKDLANIIDLSITQTVKRSIYSSSTVVFVLIAILLVWPEAIKWFTLVMLYWTIVWTFSSIFIASPLLYDLNKWKTISEYKKVEKTADDLTVV